MICHKCSKVVLWEKMITPDGKDKEFIIFNAGIGMRKNNDTYETKTKFIECAICHRVTSDRSCRKFLDILDLLLVWSNECDIQSQKK